MNDSKYITNVYVYNQNKSICPHFNNAEEYYETLSLWFWNLQEK